MDMTTDGRLWMRMKTLIVQGTKTHAVRNVGLDEETSRLLREHRDRAVERGTAAGVPSQPADFVFERAPGSGDPAPARPHRPEPGTGCAETLASKARLHDLRHLQASLSLDAGEAVTTVAARLGPREPGAGTRAAGIVGAAFRRPNDEEPRHPGV